MLTLKHVERTCLSYANIGADHPAHPRSLISTFKHNTSTCYLQNLKASWFLKLSRPVWVLPGRKPRRQVFSWWASFINWLNRSQAEGVTPLCLSCPSTLKPTSFIRKQKCYLWCIVDFDAVADAVIYSGLQCWFYQYLLNWKQTPLF